MLRDSSIGALSLIQGLLLSLKLAFARALESGQLLYAINFNLSNPFNLLILLAAVE